MGAKEELARLKGLQAQKPTGRDIIKSAGTPKQMMQVAKPKLPQAPATKPNPKAPEFSGRLSGHGMNLDVDTYKESYSAAHDSPSAQRTEARASAIGHNIVGGFASFGETYSQKVKDRLTNMKNMDKIAPYKNQLDPLKKQRADLLTKARYRGKDAAEKMMGVKLSDLDTKIAEVQKGYNAVVANNPVDPNKYGQRTLRLAAQEQQAAKNGISVDANRVKYLADPSRKLTQEEKQQAREIVGQLNRDLKGKFFQVKRTPEDLQKMADIAALEAKYKAGTQFGLGVVKTFGGEALNKNATKVITQNPKLDAALPNAVDTYKSAATQSPGAYLGGQFVGEGLKYATSAKALGAIPKVGQALQSKNMLTRIGAASAVDLPMDIASAALYSDGDKGEFAKQLGLNVGLGLGAGAGIEAIGSGIRAAKNGSVKLPFARNAAKVEAGGVLPMKAREPILPNMVQQKKSYMQQVDAVIRGTANPRSQIIVGDTSAILSKFGANSNKLTLDYSDIRKIAYPDGYMGGKHNLGFYALEQLPNQLENPVAVLKSSTQPNSLVVFTELLDAEGRPVMVPIHLDKNGRAGVSNEIASMYGRKKFDQFISTQREAGNVVYEDKNKSLQSLPASGLQLSGVEAKADPIFNSNVPQVAHDVNSKSMQMLKDYEHRQDSSEFGENTVGAAQSAYPSRQKISKVRSNTIANSTMFTKAEKEMLDHSDYRYDVVSEKQSIAEAKQRLQNDFDGEVKDLPTKRDFSGEDLDTSMGVLEKRLDEARETGDYSKVKEWSKMVQEKGTQGGQMIQAFAKYSRTPEGAVVKAQQAVDSVEREIKKTKPRVAETAKEETKLVENAVSSAEKEASAEAAKLLPEEMLARRIDATTKAPKQRDNAIQDMVNELFRSAKESPLPEQSRIKRSPVDALAKAIQNKEQYADAWEKAKAILKTKYTDDLEVSSMLDDYFEKGIIPTYSTKTLTGSVSEAVDSVGADLNQIIKQSKWDKEKLLQDITEYLTTKTGATGEQAQLLSEQIAKRYDEILKEKTASKLQSMFKERPKLTHKSLKEQVMELINMGAYETDDLRALVSKRNGIPVLTNEDTKNIIEYMTEAQKHTEGSYDRKMWESRAEQIIADKVPATFREKFRGMQRLSMLLNPKTLITRNPLGNTILGIAENVKDVPGTMIDKLIGVKTGERTTSISIESLVAQGEGFVQGLADWTKDIKNHVDTSPSRGQMELPNNRIFNGKLLHTLDIFERRTLQLGDRPFYQSAYNGRLAELKKLGVTGEEAKLQARLFALDRVFQNDSTLAKKAGAIRREMGIVGDLIMPFTQTPANVMDKLIDYSPVGLGKAMFQLGKASKDGGFDQKLFVDRVARTFTGSGILMLGYALASAGLATGDLDKDKDVRAAQYAYGVNPYSFKFGYSYYSFDWAQPIGGLLSIGANAFTAGKESKDFVGKVMAGTEAGINTVFSQQFLQGVFNMLSGYNPAEGIGKSLLGSTSQATPSGLAAIAKTIDPNVRETYDPNAIAQQGKKLAARLPGVSMMLPKKLDAFGDLVLQSQGRNLAARAFENFLSPGKLTTLQHRDVYDELNRLYDKTGSKSVFPNVPLKSFTLDGETINLSSKEYETFAKMQGDIVQKNLKSLLSSNGYKNMSDDLKSDSVAKLYEYAGAVAKSKVSSYKIPDALQKVKDAESKGIKPAEYMVAYAAQKDVVGDSDGQGGTIHGTEKSNKREAIDAVSGGLSDEHKMLLYDSLNAGLAKKQAEGYETLKTKGMSEYDFMKYLDVVNNSRGLKNQKTGKTIRVFLKSRASYAISTK